MTLIQKKFNPERDLYIDNNNARVSHNMPPEEFSNAAVLIRGANKTYGNGNSTKIVFDNLNMTVPRGSIYGLLGASGCGKTTLLSCVVGIKELNSGDIWVLGGKPGTPGSGVPGPRVGFMPQDISLISEFSVKGAVYYFGRIFELSDSQLSERFTFLSNLLDLPPPDRYIKNCSGGQQRRVSLAAALVHEPELLILDEPTVGLDPVLRDRIWNHLVDITVRNNVAVIITTHYIEETKQAHNIGLMRGGKLMAEESPERLISIFNVESLEDAFLILSQRQTRGEVVPEFETIEYKEARRKREEKYASRVISEDVIPNNGSTFALTSANEEKSKRPLKKYKTYSSRRLKALLVKNTHQIVRNYSGLVYTILFPVIEMLSFFLGVGSNPKGMTLGVVNFESTWQNCNNYTKFYPTVTYDGVNDICEFSMMSCRFLDKVNDTVARKVFFDDPDSARECVVRGDCLGYMQFGSNFSEAAMARQEDGRFTSDEDLDASEIQVYMDMSNRQLGAILKQQLYDLYFEYLQDILPICNVSKKAGTIPIRFEQPVYGNLDDEYLIFMYPAVLTTLIFYMGTTITSTSIVVDRLEGVWDRSLVSGVTHGEILLTHFCSQFVLVFIQVVEMLFISYVGFNMRINGSFLLTVGLLLCQGVNGMLNGFLISISCGTITLANIVVTGSFFIIVMLCGLLWPIEGMPTFLRIFSQCMPFTLPISSVRSVVIKGLTLTSPSVWFGALISVIWMFIYALISYVILKRKS